MNAQAPAGIGHNFPPDPIDEAIAPYGDLIEEVSNWTDGEAVSDDAAMASVDELIRAMKSARSVIEAARKDATEPLHKAWKAEVARWKVTTDDLDVQQKCLVALVAPYKAEKLRQQEEERRAAAKAARDAEDAAREASRKAMAGNLELAREAQAAQAAFDAAQEERKRVEAEKVKGTRTVTRYEITGMSDLLRWMNKDEAGRAALEACAADFVRKNHKATVMHGVRTWQEREAF